MTILIILIALVVTIGAALTYDRLRRTPGLRSIRAYESLPLAVGEAVESDRAVHLSLGSAGLGGESTTTALAGAEILYHVARRAAIGDRSPVVSLSDPTALGLAQDTLRRAYADRGVRERYEGSAARWLPYGDRSLTFAAGANSMIADDKVSSLVMVGRFGPEMALMGEVAARKGYSQVAAADDVEGQAVAYAVSDEPLIGEEMFVGGAYLAASPVQMGGVIAQDFLRWLIVLGILISVAASTLGISW